MSTNNDLLIDRLDNNLSENDSRQVDNAIASEQDVASEWAFLKLAVETIGLGAITEKVAAVRATVKNQAPVVNMEKKEAVVVRGMFKNTMRIAAVAVLILGASIAYKYMAVDNISMYKKSFAGYELSTSRGDEASTNMEAAYRSQNWVAVLDAFRKQGVKTNKSYFLAGVAELQLEKYAAAVAAFEHVILVNNKSGNTYFEPECEYFVALAYLANNQSAKGVEMIRKIRRDVNHPYYPLASKMSTAELKILEFKSK